MEKSFCKHNGHSIIKMAIHSSNKRNKVVKISKEEEGFIRKIKGGNFRNENEIAKKLLKEVRLLPRFEKEEYVRKINPDRKIMSTGKT